MSSKKSSIIPSTFLNTLGGVRKCVVVLFTDLRGFTSITEEADSTELVKQLNEYFNEMVKPVFDNRGTLDKFIGDAIMAVWGNLHTEGPDVDVDLAVKTALQMKKALAILNEGWEARGIRRLAMGIGINLGEAIVGNIGSDQKMDPTVIGDPVNLASRFESLTKEYGVDMLIGENSAAYANEMYHLQLLDYIQVKGKTEPVNVYTVIAPRTETLDPATREYLIHHSHAVQRYRAMQFSRALELFRKCLAIRPGDKLANMYIERCLEFQENPPDPSWNRALVYTTK